MPRPVSFGGMSDNFDSPPASSTSAPNNPPAVSRPPSRGRVDIDISRHPPALPPMVPPRLESLNAQVERELERIDANYRGRSIGPIVYPPPPMPSSDSPQETRRRRAIRNIIARRTINQNANTQPLYQAGSRSHPRATPSDRFHQRHSQSEELARAGMRLGEVGTEVRSLFDVSTYHNIEPGVATREAADEAEQVRAFKRRKTTADKCPPPGFEGFSYGHYGQVEAGPLKMRILSCDGGITDSNKDEKSYSVDNVLRQDNTVYCTRSKISTCNLLLSHQGETTFCVQKMIIRAPNEGYTAPVQQGMIFISMTNDDLIERSSDYRLRFPTFSPSISRTSSSSTDYRGPLPPPPAPQAPLNLGPRMESAQAHASAHIQELLRRHQRQRIQAEVLHLAGQQEAPLPEPTRPEESSSSESDEENAYPETPIPLAFPSSNTSIESPSTEELEEGPARTLGFGSERRARLDMRRPAGSQELLQDEGASSDDEEFHIGEARWSSEMFREDRAMQGRRVRALQPAQRRLKSCAIEGEGKGGTWKIRSKEGLKPHANFFISKDSNSCSIEFDPPVSGRYLLVKLFSPSQNENIDVQSIITYGFAGPRFFGSITPA